MKDIRYLTISHIETLNVRAADNGYVTLSSDIMNGLRSMDMEANNLVVPIIATASVSDVQKIVCLALDFLGNVAMLGISHGDYSVLPTKEVSFDT